jgi:hypothetical protein
MAVVYKHVNETPPPLRSVKADAPAWLEAVLEKTLAKQPADRFRRAAEMAEALRQQRLPGQTETVSSRRERRVRTPPPRLPPKESPRRPGQPRRSAGGARLLVAAIVVLVLALVVGTAYVLLDDSSTEPPGTSTLVTLVVTPERVTRVVTSAPAVIVVTPEPIQPPTAAPKPTASSEWDIPSLPADLTELRFFEAGYNQPARDERVYSRRFAAAEARYISYELNLEFPERDSEAVFEVEAVYYRPDGSVLSDFVANYHLQPGWTTSWHAKGWGWDEPGNWSTGQYRVELYVEGQQIASDTFEIY